MTVSNSGLRVMREQCSTCIFRPGNLMQLRPGRMADMTRQTDLRDTNVSCHQMLEAATRDQHTEALCRGSVDRRPGQMMRIAERLGMVVLVDG